MIKLIIGVGDGVALPLSSSIGINLDKFKLMHYCIYSKVPSDLGGGIAATAHFLTVYNKRIVFRNATAIAETTAGRTITCALFGNFNYDTISVYTGTDFTGRVEIRNENDVLITDNGRPWGDGTYPPDAKNRAGLTGLHVAPIASSNEFADLSGLDPNKEEEITEAERGAGIEYALERDEDNGF